MRETQFYNVKTIMTGDNKSAASAPLAANAHLSPLHVQGVTRNLIGISALFSPPHFP